MDSFRGRARALRICPIIFWNCGSGRYPMVCARCTNRFFVAGKTLGSFRSARETVMAETPARSAMSFREILGAIVLP